MTRLWRCALMLLLLGSALSAQVQLRIITSSLPQGTVGTPYNASLAATGGTTPYFWTVASGTLPPGLTLSTLGTLGTITGTPTAGGTYTVTFRVADANQTSAVLTLNMVVLAPVQFSVSTTSLPVATQGQSYSQVLVAANGTPPYQWAVTQGLPPGLTLSASGTISGTPTTLGTFSFQVQATDSAQHTAVGALSITVNPAPLTITTVPPLFSGIVGIAYSQSFSASGGRPPYTWSILSGGVTGLTLDPTSGTLQGTPQTAGTFSLTVQAADSAGSKVSESFSLVVNQPSLTLIVSGQLPAGAVGVAYSQKFPIGVSGGTAPYTWSVTGGSVPGLVFDPVNVALSGTPTAPGSFTLTVQVRDSAGLTSSRPFSLTIAPAALTITTVRQLPDATFNTPVSVQFVASGGAPPYTWAANGLPTGLAIDANSGIVSGSPIAAGNFSFAVTVSDSALNHYSDRFSINVDLPPTPNVTITGLSAVVPAAQQFTVQVALAAAFPVDITGQAILSFAPDSGPTDRTVLFASGGTTASFTIPAGSTTPSSTVPLALQTGTVSGTITISLRLQAGVSDITPSPAPTISTQIVAAAPVIQSAQMSLSGNTISITVTGYTTAREITQAVFAFSAASGQTLQAGASSITVPVDTLFGSWFQDSTNAAYGSQFVYTQTFTIQGTASAVIPQSVTLTNRIGSTTSAIH